MDKRITVADLQINTYTKQELLAVIRERLAQQQKTFMVTPYSEFLYGSLHNGEVRGILNAADLSIADGIGILWAQYFLSRPFHFENYYLKIAEAWLQIVYTGAAILLAPGKLYQVIPEKIVGADLIWDLSSLAAENGYSVYLLGARGSIAKQAAEVLQTRYPGLRVAGTSNKEWNDETIVEDIRQAKPDLIFVAFFPPMQERWIRDHLHVLPATFAVGLGGTFDYITGHRSLPPRFVRKVGLEWLYRLITQPFRIKRIYNAVVGLILSLLRYKVFSSLPFRQNVSVVVVNKVDQVFIARRTPDPKAKLRDGIADNYWQFPQGGVDEGEEIVTAAKRELREETGMQSTEVLGVSNEINRYDWANGRRSLLQFKYRYRGQEQRTVFLRFTGGESEIVLDNEELVEHRWVTINQALQQLAAERKPHAAKVLQELSHLLENHEHN